MPRSARSATAGAVPGEQPMTEDQVQELLRAMTLEEQVALLAGADFWTTVPVARLGIPAIKVSDGPNGARGGGSLVGGVRAASFPVAIGARRDLGPEARRGDRRSARRGGALEGRPRPARADGQHPPLAAERPQLRVLLGGPAARGRDRGRLCPGRAEQGRRGDHQAFRRQRVRVRAHDDQLGDRRAHAARDLSAAVRGGGAGRPASGR